MASTASEISPISFLSLLVHKEVREKGNSRTLESNLNFVFLSRTENIEGVTFNVIIPMHLQFKLAQL